MKLVAVLLITTLCHGSYAEEANPLGKVFSLITALEKQITAEGEAEAKAYKEFFEWCDDAASNTNFEIKTGTEKKAKTEAKIGELTSDVEVGTAKIEDLSEAVSSAEAQLKEATSIRDTESSDFQASEQELMSTIDTLARATSVLEKEMSASSASFAQVDTHNMQSIIQSLSVVVDAAGFSSNDRSKLVALVQSTQAESEDDELGAPAAAAHSSKSGSIVEVIEDLKEKAEGELAAARKAESKAAHDYAMLKQSLEDKIAADTKDMDEEKSNVAAAGEGKAAAEADLAVTVKDLANSKKALKIANSDCMTSAADHEMNIAARTEELKVIAEAEKILKESTGAAEGQTYFLQVKATSRSRAEARAALKNSEVAGMIKKLAKAHHSAALAQLASRVAAVVRYGGAAGEDPFAKVKGLITDMISKLEKEADSEATEKAYCDEQTAKTKAKKSDLDDDISKLSSKMDQAASRSAELKEEVAELQSELAAIAKMQAEADGLRSDAHALYSKAKSELTAGIDGVRKALTVLREYYGGAASAAAMLQDDTKFGDFMEQPKVPEKAEKSSGAGGSIISILEIVESDMASGLSKEETKESDDVASYEKLTEENKLVVTAKEQDVKYKSAEAASLDKSIAELSSDKDSASSELEAVMEYYSKIEERCVAKPESYKDRKAKREAEISGLKEALTVLENEVAFMQRRHHRRNSRFMAAL